jgi:two-component system sensor histidine kinase KdpD
MKESLHRPDPDELLNALKSEEETIRHGKLKIFFGMCAGVGKTYTMLETALAERGKGVDIVIGYIETHGRKETDKLTEGFEIVPRKLLSYKSASFSEMDIDAIISRKPQIVLVDELAHSNVPGSRHAKRVQDVSEILENGINVYTTLNVQHLESRSEIVTQVTGILVRETIPDEIFENAWEVELVDLSTEELLQRLAEGKVYTPDKSGEAIKNFFKKENITALREMALRIVAERVDKQLREYMQNKSIKGPWKSGLHLLVAIGPGPNSGRLLRWAKILSYSMGATIQSVYVEPTGKLTAAGKEQLNRNINLSKKLGISFSLISDLDKVKGILNFAQKENITHIIVGKPLRSNFLQFLKSGNFINRLIRYSGDIDVYILNAGSRVQKTFNGRITKPSFTSTFKDYFVVILFVILTTLICFSIKDLIGYQVVSFILLFLVSILSLFYGIGPILIAATLSASIWDYFFIPPYFTMHIYKPVDVLMLIMFFIIALMNGILTSRTRRQEEKIRVREERTRALYQLTKDLNSVSGFEDVIKIAKVFIQKYFILQCQIAIRNDYNQLDISNSLMPDGFLSGNDKSIAEWVFKNNLKAGRFTSTLPSGKYTFYPLSGTNVNMGVLIAEHEDLLTFGEEQFWDTSLSQISAKLEREYFREAAKKAYVISESEKLYKTLFNSISHELRIPVTTIMAASDNIISDEYPEEAKRKFNSEINQASIRLNHLIDNLLNMSRLESGRISPNANWCDVHDLANKVAESLDRELSSFTLSVIIPEDMPMVYIDFGLMEQAIHNLVLNSVQHSPHGSVIRLKFFYDNGFIVIQVMDRGSGFEEADLDSIFNKFYRGKNSAAGGSGLGLSIVKGFVEAHKGIVVAENRQNGGAKVTIRIPAQRNDPKINL